MSEKKNTPVRKPAAAGTSTRRPATTRRPAGTSTRRTATGTATRRPATTRRPGAAAQARRKRVMRDRIIRYGILAAAAVILILLIVVIVNLSRGGGTDTPASVELPTLAPLDMTEPETEGEGDGTDEGEADAMTEGVTEDVGEDGASNGTESAGTATSNTQTSASSASSTSSASNADPTVPIFPYGQEVTGLKLGQSSLQQRVSETYPARAANRPTAQADGWLPIFMQGSATNERIIAITVDDCFQANNLKRIIECAMNNNGKLTIFPIGKNIETKPEVREQLRVAYNNGMEIECHTYSHNGLFAIENDELAFEVFAQVALVSQTLGVNYQPHFLRPKGGDARADQRMHTYADQLGFYGIAHWSDSGSGLGIESLKKGLHPGAVYLFHTTDKDLSKLLEFIPYAVSQGYELVTLNDMFGYPANETSELISLTKEDVVPLREYTQIPVMCKKGSYSYLVKLIQDRLYELGYLSKPGDGDYGKNTVSAVKAFQTRAGLEVDGYCGETTQAALFADTAPHY